MISPEMEFKNLSVHMWSDTNQAMEFEADYETEVHEDPATGGAIVVKHFTRVNGRELIEWILGFGPSIEILEPAELRSEIKDVLECTSRLYSDVQINLPRDTKTQLDRFVREEINAEGKVNEPEYFLNRNIERKLANRKEISGLHEIPESERTIAIWLDTEEVNSFRNSPLEDGQVEDGFYNDSGRFHRGIVFTGSWTKSNTWILGQGAFACVLAPNELQLEIAQAVCTNLSRYQSD